MLITVIFRKWKQNNGGGIIALFPEEPADNYGLLCESYEHIGQHAGADPFAMRKFTRLAKEHEYADLLNELKNIGYDDLLIVKRMSPLMFQKRRMKARGIGCI